jgi:aspartyl-tRNA(Asn)/glutamyl-tRNA(Gln) amidotransferase subunit C
MLLSKEKIEHLAKLARLKLSPEQTKKYQRQLGEILNYIKQLKKIKTDNIEVCSGGGDLKSVFRTDKSESKRPDENKKILEQVPEKQNRLIKVKKVL